MTHQQAPEKGRALDDVRAYVAKQSRAIEEQAAANPPVDQGPKFRTWGRGENLTPLTERLAKLLDEIPDTVKTDGLKLETLRERLHGRRYRSAHAGEVGKALRKLGYEVRRDYSNTNGGDSGSRWFKRGA